MRASLICLTVLFSGLFAADDTAMESRGTVDVVVNVGGAGPRPYVVVWVEDKEGRAVRTLRVWGNRPKYYRHLRAWKAAGGAAVDGVSGATRPNGAYRTTWDGLGADGQPLPPGKYVLRAECVREKGGRSGVSLRVPEGEGPLTLRGEGNGDITSIEVKKTENTGP